MTKHHDAPQHSIVKVLTDILQSPLVQEQAGLALAEAAQGIQLISRMINQFLSSSNDGGSGIAGDMSAAFTSLSKQLRHMSTPDPANILHDVIRSLDDELATLANHRGAAVDYKREAICAVRDILSRHTETEDVASTPTPKTKTKSKAKPKTNARRSSRPKK